VTAINYPFPEHDGSQDPATRPPSRYAICVELDPGVLAQVYGPTWQNAYADVGRFMEANGFVRRYGTIYFGDDTIVAVHCMMVAQKLALEFDWFVPAAADVRMLRIEGNNDLRSAMELAVNARRR
jgi:virulence-associated protein VapD